MAQKDIPVTHKKASASPKVINADGKKITLDSNVLDDNAKYVIIMGDNSTITINGDVYINSKGDTN